MIEKVIATSALVKHLDCTATAAGSRRCSGPGAGFFTPCHFLPRVIIFFRRPPCLLFSYRSANSSNTVRPAFSYSHSRTRRFRNYRFAVAGIRSG